MILISQHPSCDSLSLYNVRVPFIFSFFGFPIRSHSHHLHFCSSSSYSPLAAPPTQGKVWPSTDKHPHQYMRYLLSVLCFPP